MIPWYGAVGKIAASEGPGGAGASVVMGIEYGAIVPQSGPPPGPGPPL